MPRTGKINRAIRKSRSLTESGNHGRAAAWNLRAIGMLERAARFDVLHGLADRPALAGLYCERAGILARLMEWDSACDAAETAVDLYLDVDPARGAPDLVAVKVREFRAEHGDAAVVPFEEHIGDAANARGFLALLLARNRGAAAKPAVERLGSNAVQTFTELIRVGLAYDREDLRRIRDQVSQAHRLLTAEAPSQAWRSAPADILAVYRKAMGK
ncbi:hypothetical protein [Sciscionella sediminilitoris]|uniref:hypothetical protein n=1 Tax=Sciscionella sediminilitoris TaxID=1445613 RepID=UPI0004DF91F4|nr:hypothetical protein [Sciscionella sp. SE31]